MNSNHQILIEAPAKVNLFLHILAKRHDGYHKIESLIAFTEFSDSISIFLSDTIELSVSGRMSSLVTADDSNIVIEAAKLLKEKFSISSGASIFLKKQLPVSAGLGGGSSDAAATLLGLINLWKINISTQELIGLICESGLGADVPVCLIKKPALVKGIGEKIEPLGSFSSFPILLINPGVPISTKEIFSRIAVPDKCPVWKVNRPTIESLNLCRNDLQSEAIKTVPIIKNILFNLSKMQGCLLSRVSGSGPTCYGLFDSEENLRIAAKKFMNHDDWWVMPTRLRGIKAIK